MCIDFFVDFPIKFYSVYKHHVERVFCKKDGCETKILLTSVLNKENNIFIKAVPDLKTFEKLFTYNLSERLFNRIGLLNVALKDTLQNQKDIAEEKHYAYMNRELDKQQQNDPFIQMEREARQMRERQRITGCEVGCGAPPLRVFGGNRNNGSINFNLGFGKGRNRGNINIFTDF